MNLKCLCHTYNSNICYVTFYSSEMRAAKFRKDKSSQIVENLVESQNNRLARFGRFVPRLQHMIEEACKAGRFKQKPRGPLGAYVTLKVSFHLYVHTIKH